MDPTPQTPGPCARFASRVEKNAMFSHNPSCLKGPIARARFRRSSPDIRRELVERIRREIAEGTYDTPEKWELALERLLDRLEEE